MATYTGNFVLARIHMNWEYTGPDAAEEDVRVCTFHAINLEGGIPTTSWPPGDLAQLDSRFDTFWQTLRPSYSSLLNYKSLKVYLAGPTILPPQEPIYEDIKDLSGTATGASLPPQVAISVTEKVGAQKGWGRFYLPGFATENVPGVSTLTASGRLAATFQDGALSAALALYRTLQTDTTPIVIYHPYLPARPTKGGGTLPERPAEAVEVTKLQIDEVLDVIRRRRYEHVARRVEGSIP